MKLLTKLNSRYILYSLSVMVVSGILIYMVISTVVNKELDEKLADISLRIEQKLTDGGKVDYLQPFVEVSEISNARESKSISDTIIRNERENELEEYRQLTVVKKINESYYKIVVRESKLESEDLIGTLAGVTLLGLLLLTGSLILVNRKVAKSIWTPFNRNLKEIGGFSLQERSPLILQKTGITEFDTLNEVVSNLTIQIIADFQNLKQFSEDASHEIQTPLAIISAKLETVLNDPELTGSQLETMRAILASVRRLAKLNKELLLLTKIENNQFIAVEQISLEKVIREKLTELQELLELKEIAVELNFTDDFLVKSNFVLTELLINNLISNSINHNISGGLIRIVQKESKLEIWNTGRADILHPEYLFSRFYKENPSSGSVGLGLAIVHEICDVQKWKVTYRQANGIHCFQVDFRS
ncbi:MAG TPA: HAMP domain-containing sensor histidine kinase [Prolixibacteraceae bacterium]|nr:HAMP domain-containing sensor histidine kinase [Prolixibacteraceae bacterium]